MLKPQNIRVIETNEEVGSAVKDLLSRKVVGVDTEVYQPNHYTNHLLTVQLAADDIVYVINRLKVSSIEPIKEILEAEKILKIYQNALFDMLILHQELRPDFRNSYDTYLGEKLLTAGLIAENNLKAIAKKYINVELTKNWEVLDWKNMFFTKTLTDEQVKYAAYDAYVLPRVYPKQLRNIEEKGLKETLNLEHKLIPVVLRMKLNGINIDKEGWSRQIKEITEVRNRINKEIQSKIKKYFFEHETSMFEGDTADFVNLNSPKQLLELFNEKMGIKISSTGESTLKEVDNEIAGLILEYREHEKIIKAFGQSLLEKINLNTNRLHPDFKQVGTDTGRFSCSNPNFQQIPVHGEGAKLRNFVIPGPGGKFVIADYSQQELRILAYCGKDEAFLKAFRNGVDLHKLTASRIFEVEMDKVTDEQRATAKTLNFGIIYGMGARALSRTLKISREEATALLEKHYQTYPAVKSWLDKVGNEAAAKGYTSTLIGRKRFYDPPSRDNPDAQRILAGIRRAAMNHPTQGSGADMIKIALVKIHNEIEIYRDKAKIVNTIHDEIMVECEENLAKEISEIVEREMREAGESLIPGVPVKVNCVIVDSWGEA